MALDTLAETYARDGYVSAVPVLTPEEALDHRRQAEAAHGPIHYKAKMKLCEHHRH